jgi:hypothetical protein
MFDKFSSFMFLVFLLFGRRSLFNLFRNLFFKQQKTISNISENLEDHHIPKPPTVNTINNNTTKYDQLLLAATTTVDCLLPVQEWEFVENSETSQNVALYLKTVPDFPLPYIRGDSKFTASKFGVFEWIATIRSTGCRLIWDSQRFQSGTFLEWVGDGLTIGYTIQKVNFFFFILLRIGSIPCFSKRFYSNLKINSKYP